MRSSKAWGLLGIGVGVAMILAALFIPMRQEHAMMVLLSFGIAVTVIGALVMSYFFAHRSMSRVNRPADDAYEVGRQTGYDKGWRDCARKQITGVHPMKDRRHAG
jgi:hypothetical protein